MSSFTVPLKLITMPYGGIHLMCFAKLNGYKLNILVDTGASMTVFDHERIMKIIPGLIAEPFQQPFTGIGSEKVSTSVVELHSLTMENRAIEQSRFLLIDMSPINQAYASIDMERVDGVLGGDILKKYNAIIDYPNQTMSFYYTGNGS